MKKFQTKRKKNYFFPLILILCFVILFIVLSFCKLKNNYDDLIMAFWNNNEISLIKKNINIGNMLKLLNFKKEKQLVYEEKKNNIILLECESDIESDLINNLSKLGIKAIHKNESGNYKYILKVIEYNNNDVINVKKKNYNKMSIKLPTNMLPKIKDYLDNNFPNVIENYFSSEENIIEISLGKKNNGNNSTEIIALLMYYILGD